MAVIFPFIPKRPNSEEDFSGVNLEEKWEACQAFYSRAGRLSFGPRFRLLRPDEKDLNELYTRMKRLGGFMAKFYDDNPDLYRRYLRSLGSIESLMEEKKEEA